MRDVTFLCVRWSGFKTVVESVLLCDARVVQMNSLCDSFLSDDSLHELSEMSDFLLASGAQHIKTEPADVIEQVGHVTVTSRAPAFVM